MNLILKSLLLSISLLAIAPASETIVDEPKENRVELSDGSILFAHEIAEAEEGTKKISTAYGTLLIPEDEIESIRFPYERFSFHESWIIINQEGKAKATILISLPKTSSGEHLFPLIESSYKPLITAVKTVDEEEIKFEQVDRGPIVFVRLNEQNLPKNTEQLLVEFTTASALQKSSDGASIFKRRFTPDYAGEASIKINVADDLAIYADGNTSTEYVEKQTLRRQQDWVVEVEIGKGSN